MLAEPLASFAGAASDGLEVTEDEKCNPITHPSHLASAKPNDALF